MAAAGGLFHNLGSFTTTGSSMHTSQTGSSEFLTISNTRHFGPSGGRFLAELRGITTNSIAHCYSARGRSGKLGTYRIWGQRVSPTPVAQKRGHDFNIASLNRWLPAGKVERHGWM